MLKTAAPLKASIARNTGMLRILFGVIWAIDAVFKWQPAFLNGFLEDVKGAAAGQPGWLHWWFNFWIHLLSHAPHLFAVIVAVMESLVALGVLLGLAKRYTYILGGALALLIWAVGEGFGGPYVAGSTDIGTGIIYFLLFVALYQLEKIVPSRWSLAVRARSSR